MMRRLPVDRHALALRQVRRRRMIAVAPSLLTLGNAVCGFACITYAASIGPEEPGPSSLYTNLHFAAMFIFGAIIFDGLDGPLARLAKQTSEFGAQLDSLADAISFGVAPAFLMLKFSPVLHPRLCWGIAVLYMLCAVLRLARFNVNKDDAQWKGSFCGLPSPAAAGTIASLVVVGPGLLRWTRPEATDAVRTTGEFLLKISVYCLPVVTLAVACLMVSRIRYPKPTELLQGKRSYRHLVNVMFFLVVVFAVHELAIPIILLWFVMAAPVRALANTIFFRQPPPVSDGAVVEGRATEPPLEA
ncbi:MAG: CDP-diacylglycerol--serine O-phosphatidyltransferase [Pirellulaceae bacterium]